MQILGNMAKVTQKKVTTGKKKLLQSFLISWSYLLVSDILVQVGMSFILSSCSLVKDIAKYSEKHYTRK